MPGSGAAGGLAGGLAAVGARLVPGAALVADVVGLREPRSDRVARAHRRGAPRRHVARGQGRRARSPRGAGVRGSPAAVVAGDAGPGTLADGVACVTLVELAGSVERCADATQLASPPARRGARRAALRRPVEDAGRRPAAVRGTAPSPASRGREAPCTTPNARRRPHMSQLIDTGSATRTAASPDILVFPGDPGWDDARRAWNLAVDQRPAAVALPETVDDVVDAVDYARTLGLRIAVQGTGHGAPAHAPRRHDARQHLADDRRRGRRRGRASRVSRRGRSGPTSSTPPSRTGSRRSTARRTDVGVVGYSLGGGIGWLARKHGLSSSSVPLGRGRDRRRRGRPCRPGDERRPLLGAPRRRRQLRRRDRGRDRPLPRRRRRTPAGSIWPMERAARGARRLGRVDAGRPRGGHVGRPDAPDPAHPGDARAVPRPPARRRRGRVPR